MNTDLSLQNVLGLAAGALVIATGGFVFAARPASWLHRLFFAWTLVDGAGTILTRLRAILLDAPTQVYLQEVGWYMQIATLAGTAVFAVVFPRPTFHERLRVGMLGAVGAATACFLASYFLAPTLHWRAVLQSGQALIVYGPLGVLEHVAVVVVTALVVARLGWLFLRDPSPSHRRQAALFLAGFLLNEGPYPATELASGMRAATAYFGATPWFLEVDHLARALAVAVLVAVCAMLATDRSEERRQERRLVLAAFAGVGVITLAAFVQPAQDTVRLFRIVGLVAYPLVLAYAVMRYELFDIDAQLRRAATVSLALGALAAVFIVAQNAVQELLQERLLAGVPSAWTGGAIAALATAVLSVPIVKVSRHVGRRVLPELSVDQVHQRKLEVYRHSLEGALADGVVDPRESRALAALRQSLGLTLAEHDAIAAEARPLHAPPGGYAL